MSELRIGTLEREDADGLDQAYAIYRDAIEKSEQRTEAEFRLLAGREDYSFLLARRDGAVVGVAVSWAPKGSGAWLFEYAAVVAAERGAGIGAQLFVASRMIAGTSRVALVEVDAGESEIEIRRRGFYARLGCRLVRGLDYILPLDAFGAPPPMRLMALAPSEMASVAVDVVEGWLRALYAEVYGQSLSDPRLARMIDPLPDEVMLDPA